MIANDVAALELMLAEARRNFRVERIPWSHAAHWHLVEGAFQHSSRGFFSVAGVAFGPAPKDQAVLLYQPQGAITGLLTTTFGGERHYLLQARAEPGCLGGAQFGPTVQSTPANYLGLHGGKGVPYINCFSVQVPGVRIIADSTQSDLGERYLMKSKRLIVAECPADIPVHPGFAWASATALRAAVGRSAFLNIDLRALLAVAPWDEAGLQPRREAMCRSLIEPVRVETVGWLTAALAPAPQTWHFHDIEAQANWHLTEWGLSEIEPRQGFAVEFYATTAEGREVAQWVQPLINSSSMGRAALYCREGERFEVLVRIVHERGLANGVGLGPSVLHYPGAKLPEGGHVHRTLLSTVESDEGGRFFQDANSYELVDAPEIEDQPDGRWVTLAELKTFLAMSNLCTIQLRGLASHLLGL